MFKRILIANRGEIAVRIIRTAHAMGIETVAVYSDVDESALHVQHATIAVGIGAAPAQQSYLDSDKIIQAALKTQADAIHPGYGFLSENPDFVSAVETAGLVFIGPSASAIKAMGLKDAAKQRMSDAGVPVVPGYHGADQTPEYLQQQADQIGYPLLIKARSGGGGKGMRLVTASAEFNDHLSSAVREATASFGDPAVLLEKFVDSPRHIEVQVFGDNHGTVVHLFERDCTLQRRHQKVVEEAPAPGMTDSVRRAMTDAAITAAQSINYSNAGTIEFIVDGSGPLREDGFWFMEMNTRLQVEHPVTENITGFDLVEWQIRIAAGEPIPVAQSDIQIQAHSVEVRLYAEDPENGFLPVSGKLHDIHFSEHARVDAGVRSGDTITPFYDPMLAKIITTGDNRTAALRAMTTALNDTHVAGTATNLGFLSALVVHDKFVEGTMDTGLIDERLEDLLPPEKDTHFDRLLACLILSKLPNFNHQPKNDMTGWRLWGNASFRVKLNTNDTLQTHRITYSADRQLDYFVDEHGDIPDARVQVKKITATEIQYEFNGQGSTARFVTWTSQPRGDTHLLLKNNGQTHTYNVANPLTSNQSDSINSDAVTAPMTGVIRMVHAENGDEVKADTPLVVLEAMKMETTLLAPRDGTVASVLCTEGDAVSDGDVLIELVEEAE